MKSSQQSRTGRVSPDARRRRWPVAGGRWPVGLVVAILAGTGAVVAAQTGGGVQGGTTTGSDPRTKPQTASVSFTPDDPRATPGWTLTPTFVFAQASDDNITLAGQGTPIVADSVASLSPSVDLSYLGRSTSVNGGYSGSATRYFTVNQLDTFDQRLYADVKQQLGRRVQVFAQESAGWLPATDTILLTGVPFGRVGSRIATIEGGAAIAVTRTTEVSAGYHFEHVAFDRTSALGAQLLGGYSSGVFGGVTHQITSRLSVGGSGDVRRAVVAAGLQQFDLLNAEGNISYTLAPALVVSGGFGIARIAGSLPGQDTRTGPAWHVTANYKLQRVLVYGLYLRSFVPSYGIGGTVQNQQLSAGASLPVAFRDRLIVGGNAAWRRNDPLDQTFNRLTSRWLNAYAGFGVAPWLRIEGFYSRDTQDSHLGGVLRDRVGVQVVMLAPLRFK